MQRRLSSDSRLCDSVLAGGSVGHVVDGACSGDLPSKRRFCTRSGERQGVMRARQCGLVVALLSQQRQHPSIMHSTLIRNCFCRPAQQGCEWMLWQPQ